MSRENFLVTLIYYSTLTKRSWELSTHFLRPPNHTKELPPLYSSPQGKGKTSGVTVNTQDRTAGRLGSEDLKGWGTQGRKHPSVTKDKQNCICEKPMPSDQSFLRSSSLLCGLCFIGSYSPGNTAVGFCLFTFQGSFLCSRQVTRYGLDTARPG